MLATLLTVCALLTSGSVASASVEREATGAVCKELHVRHGKPGWFLCGTHILDVIWNDGHYEFFGIGTDNAVWHITVWFDKWRSMGGQATDVADAFYLNGRATVKVAVSGKGFWCSTYTDRWSGWFRCDGIGG